MIDFIQQLSISGALLALAFIMVLTSAFHWSIRDENVATDESMVNYAQMITIFYGLLMGLVAVNLWQRMDDAEKNTVAEANQVRIVADLARSVTGDKTTLVDALGDYVQGVIKKEWPMMLDGRQREMFVASPELDSVRVAIMDFEPATTSEQAAIQEMLNHYEQMLAARQRRLLDSEFAMPAVLRITLIVGAVFIWASTLFIQSKHRMAQFVLSSMTVGYLFLLIYMILVLEQPFMGAWRVDFRPYERVLETLH